MMVPSTRHHRFRKKDAEKVQTEEEEEGNDFGEAETESEPDPPSSEKKELKLLRMVVPSTGHHLFRKKDAEEVETEEEKEGNDFGEAQRMVPASPLNWYLLNSLAEEPEMADKGEEEEGDEDNSQISRDLQRWYFV